MNKTRGFTLIELMVVVAVVAILAAIALPAYFSQIRHSRRSEVQGAMQSAALAEERVRADCTTYAKVAATADWTTAPTGCASAITLGGNPYTSSYYAILIPAATVSGTGYQIQAAAQGSQTNDSAFGTNCANLTYDFGYTTLGTVTKTPAACWSQ